MEHEVKTIILRFRDMVIQDTIFEHNQIIKDKGYVWWGWWAKPQEKVPVNEFNCLREMCRQQDGLAVYLFDSGNQFLYEANCTDIYYINGDKIPSKETDHTPVYYASVQYMAWFQFKSITKFSEEMSHINQKLQEFSYCEVDDFFVSGLSSFSPFYGKRIYGAGELQEQQRTIWFVRDYREGDKLHEIHSYSASLINGQNVERDFKLLRTNSLLWVSDLHFSKEHHAFKVEPGNDNKLSISLKRALDTLLRKDNISFVVISGDLTFAAEEEEFHLAEQFISDLNSMYQLDEKSYAVCPGNHDIRLSKEGFKEEEKVSVASEEAKENYVRFCRKIFGVEPTDNLYSIKRFLTQDMVPVEVISINTCVLQQGEHFMGMGLVGNNQLASIENDLALTKDKRVVRILVMHHHLLPVMYSEKPKVSQMYSMMLDSEAVSQFVVKNRIGLVLHGHTHKEYYAEIVRQSETADKQKFYVVGLGSTGAVQADLSEGRNNMFAVLSFSSKELQIVQYDLKPSGETSSPVKTYRIPLHELGYVTDAG